ncbi:MAG: TetR/AcrR family transcriptional regulator [Myxococcota bacterium]
MPAPIPLRGKPDPRRRILDAARELFADRGSSDVTMAEVASAAGVARATVFNHFGSKHALIEGITEEVLAAYRTLLAHAVEDVATPVIDTVQGLFRSIAMGVEEDRRFHRGVFREIAKLSLGLDEGGPGQRVRQENLEHMRELMERGQARGEFTGEHRAEDLASAFASIVYGTITHWLYADASESLPSRMERAASVFLDGASPRLQGGGA